MRLPPEFIINRRIGISTMSPRCNQRATRALDISSRAEHFVSQLFPSSCLVHGQLRTVERYLNVDIAQLKSLQCYDTAGDIAAKNQ